MSKKQEEYGSDGYPIGLVRRLQAARIEDWKRRGLIPVAEPLVGDAKAQDGLSPTESPTLVDK